MSEPISGPISDIDLNAYVDGELDAARRIEVEAYLASHPEAAARVMHDMRLRNEISLFMTEAAPVQPTAAAEAPSPGPPHARRTGWRRPIGATIGAMVDRARGRAGAGSSVGRRRAVAALCLIGIGWVLHGTAESVSVNPVAAAHAATHYITVAAQTHQQAQHSEISFKPFADAAHSLFKRLNSHNPEVTVPLPELDIARVPDGLRTVSWDGGIAVQAAYHAGREGLITLFASEVDHFAVTAPQAERIGDVAVAYWQVGNTVYALCGERSESEILAHARDARMAWF
ncbi:anti-sigma factor family protein [Azospirillum sp. sgz302134]